MSPSACEPAALPFAQDTGKRRATFHEAGIPAVITEEGQKVREGLRRGLGFFDPLTPENQQADIAEPPHLDPTGNILERDFKEAGIPLDFTCRASARG